MDPLRSLSPHSLLNIETLAALAFLVAILARGGGRDSPESSTNSGRRLPVFIGLCTAIILFYWQVLSAPFVYDDYTHITDARHADFNSIMAAFGPVENGFFYRPFGFLIYWLNYLIAGPNPKVWHAVSLGFHALDACLVYSLSRVLRLGTVGSLGGALLFAFSGSAVEPVAWIDARFDPMATALVLVSLLCVCQFLSNGRLLWLGAACLAGAAGFTTKESAFCLPLLVGCLWFFLPDSSKRLRVAFLTLGTLATLVFAYRWWALDGIGGYRGAAGQANIESFSLVRMLNAVFVRDWTILFFPVNWSTGVGWILAVMLCFTPIVFGVCVWRARPSRRFIAGSMAMTVVAALPVQHLLLIGVDLANTRYVYLLSFGWALLWGVVFTSLNGRAWRWFALAWMVTLHLLMARHNLDFWLRVPQEARVVCAEFGQTVLASSGTAIVGGLPQRKNGVVFLANGFPQCVEMNSRVPEGRVTTHGVPNFVWNSTTGRIEPVRK